MNIFFIIFEFSLFLQKFLYVLLQICVLRLNKFSERYFHHRTSLKELFLHFLQVLFMAEHHDRVASLNLCVTIDQDALSVAYQSANGDTSRQT